MKVPKGYIKTNCCQSYQDPTSNFCARCGNSVVQPTLVRVSGKRAKITHRGNLDKGRLAYSPKDGKIKWVPAIPLIEVEIDS